MRNVPAGPVLGAVVVGVDGSAQARAAALWAAGEADRRRTELRIVYAVDLERITRAASPRTIDEIYRAGHDLLRDTVEVVRARYPDLAVERELSRRDCVPALYETAGPHDTIVVGNRGLGGFGTLMLGSVGLDVLAHARRPVVIVRGESAGRAEAVVVAAVRDAGDADWLRFAAREAELRDASLKLLSVWNPLSRVGIAVTMLDDMNEMARGAERHVEALAGGLREEFTGLPVTVEIGGGMSAAGTLVEATGQADLLVLGGRRRPLGFGPTLGRVAHAVLHHADCPVLIVPRESARGEEER
ncbi:universal stress protein [Streptomyces zhihengii]|uniref:universal stress protein n=1 Tax=Streptomyces zhihengii TaxID=1818004 RepID=UPI0034520BF8